MNVNLYKFLLSEREDIIKLSTEALSRTPLRAYRESEPDTNKERLTRLFDLAAECIRKKNLIPMMDYAKKIGEERYRQHFDLQEVHAAFNILEEIMWEKITEHTDPKDYPKAFGLVSTVLGFGKESLAVAYVSLASSKEEIKSLDMSTLFRGI